MMTLIALAITVAYVYSSLTVFGLDGTDFFWELATLIVIMLLGYWIEMRSVEGASNALEQLVELMPSEAHLLDEVGNVTDVEVAHLVLSDRGLAKSRQNVTVDGKVFEHR